ncbi:hypothetical protein ACTFIW_008983 [Dictyostelium discoideum]
MSDGIKLTIFDFLLNKKSIENKNKYSCPICYNSIYKKSIYQCRYGHHACLQCWEKSLKTKQECMICRSKVNSINDLSRCLVIEQDFAKKECYCIYSFTDEILNDRSVGKKFKRELIKDEENGCKEILKVEDLDIHIQNCEFKFVKCPNEGCDKKFRLNTYGEHGNECTFKLYTCTKCKKDDIKEDQKKSHKNECPKVIIDCFQGCQMKIVRDEMKNHIENNCENTIVGCKYQEQGCEFTMKRSELQNHLESIVSHQIYMTELIDKLNSKVDQSNKIITDLNKKLEFGFNPNVYINKWTISNYSQYRKNTMVHSPEFSIFSHQFQVALCPRNEFDNNPSIYLIIKNGNGNGNFIDFESSFKLFNFLDNSKSITKHMGRIVNYKNSHLEENSVFILSKLINKENGWISDDDKLTIGINIKILNQTFPTLES